MSETLDRLQDARDWLATADSLMPEGPADTKEAIAMAQAAALLAQAEILALQLDVLRKINQALWTNK